MAPKNTRNQNTRNKQRRPSARVAAATRARQRRNRRRGIITASVLAVLLAILALLIVPGGSSKSASTTSTVPPSSTTTAAPMESAKGKPCVAAVGPLPTGSPTVPVQTGPPPTKLVIKDLKEGTGAVVKAKATLSVDYIGVACSTGKIFDSSYSRGEPASFPLDNVIAGWQQGIPGMKVGGTRLLGIPSDMAYGTQGRPPDIAPDEPLWFVVHVNSAS